jgi:class 3 adenylate cyclase/TolB-like protein
LDKPFPAYSGNEPYIFVSYAHRDAGEIYPQLAWLDAQGFNIWYDEGIEPGSEWSNELANAIQNAGTFLFFGTPRSASSNNCIDEVSYALDHGIPFLGVYLVETQLPSGMEMRLNRHQAIFKFELGDSRYQEKLASGLSKLLKLENVSAVKNVESNSELPNEKQLQRRLTTILAADVCGYTRLMDADEERTQQRVRASRKIFKKHIEAVGGWIFNTAGDSVMAEFGSVVEGVQSAIQIQDDIAAQERDSTPENRISFRMGIHLGEVMPDETGDLFGECVNVAARLEQAGIPGQITISETVLGYLKKKIDLPIEPMGSVKLKNVSNPLPLFSVVPKSATEVVVPAEGKPNVNHLGKPSWVRRNKILFSFLLVTIISVSLVTAIVNSRRMQKTLAPLFVPSPSIAVLPFTNMSSDEETKSFSEGLSGEVLNRLSKSRVCYNLEYCPRLNLAARTDTSQLFNSNAAITVIADQLDVTYVLEGSVRTVDGQLHIVTQLIKADDNTNVWSRSYDYEFKGEYFKLQNDIAQHITHMTANYLVIAELRRFDELANIFAGIDFVEAYGHFSLGWKQAALVNLGEGGDWSKSERHLKQSITISPIANSYLFLTYVYLQRLGGIMPFAEAAPLARTSLREAKELGFSFTPDGFVHWVEGEIAATFDLDYAHAQVKLNHAILLNETLVFPHYYLAIVEIREGREIEARRLLDSAKLLVGNSYDAARFYDSSSLLYLILGDFQQAVAMSQTGLVLALGGQFRSSLLRTQAKILLQQGNRTKAISVINEAWNIDGELMPHTYVSLFAKLGETDRAIKILDELKLGYVNAAELAEGYLYLGDIENTFKALELAVLNRDEQTVNGLRLAAWWDPLRDDPRFDDLLELLESEVTHTEQYLRDHKITQQDQ